VCTLYARQILEGFCIFISELKDARYPEKNTSRVLGWYWYGRNGAEFIRAVGYDNCWLGRTANCTARIYIHGPGGCLGRTASAPAPEALEYSQEEVRFAYYGFNKRRPATEISDPCGLLSRGSTLEKATPALCAPGVSERYDRRADGVWRRVQVSPDAHRRCMACFGGNDQVCGCMLLQ